MFGRPLLMEWNDELLANIGEQKQELAQQVEKYNYIPLCVF